MAFLASSNFKNLNKIRLLYLTGGRAAVRKFSSEEGCAKGNLVRGILAGLQFILPEPTIYPWNFSERAGTRYVREGVGHR